MKSYTYNELEKLVEEVKEKREILQEDILEIRKRREKLKLIDFKSKKDIDKELEGLSIKSACYNYSIVMLQLYEGSLRSDSGSMEDEELIQCERETESGDGISKLIVFCHKCFIDHTITIRDIKRLEIEASEGNLSSSFILFGYLNFFAD